MVALPTARPALGFLALFTLAGGILLQFFTILSGGVNSSPENQFYFLEASTGGIPNARNPSRWTFFAICGVDQASGHNTNCGDPVPALPFDPPRNFGTRQNVPDGFIGTHHYYYMSRFMWAFYIISLFFAVVALFTGLLAMCSRLGGYLSSLTTAVALFFQILAASLGTAWAVQGRDTFQGAGFRAKVGVKLMAFAWTSVCCFFISTILFCLGGAMGSDRRSRGVSRSRSKRSHRSSKRGSFLETDSQRRVKDEYA